MKKVIVVGVASLMLAGCNAQVIDTTWRFDRAVIRMADGTTVTGTVESWKDYDDSDAVQVKIDGVTYYTHLNNVTLIAGGK